MSDQPSTTIAERAAANPLWYHCLDLGDGVVTKGWFDLRPVVDCLPWPDVSGLRCLDVATYDGFFAFELERRGASVVVATDIPRHQDWDWLPRERARGRQYLEAVANTKGAGFEIASNILSSNVKREFISVYDLSPERIGMFDLVVCGSLLLHLRDPFRALDAIRSVCEGQFLSAEAIDPVLTARHPRRPLLRTVGDDGQWLLPNAAGHRAMLTIAGFDPVRSGRPYSIPLGPAHPVGVPTLRQRGRNLVEKALTRGTGVAMSSYLVKPI
jgi:tRNA (mo5U34)-methyltransferase